MMKAKYLIATAMAAIAFSSCSDMLETESNRLEYDPALDQKVDSMFYTLGALKGVQQAIDQYVLTNELRGDLASLTSYASKDLQEIAQFNVSESNKYDSAYVYYRIINNCNYYIANRDTTLATGANFVALKEVAEAHALRAWAYLQLTRTYGEVPFYTEPLLDVASIENVANQPKKGLAEICAALAPGLEKYASQPVPSWGSFTDDAGSGKVAVTSKMMIPVRAILGDLYLETGDYSNAAKTYFDYLKAQKLTTGTYMTPSASFRSSNYTNTDALPRDLIMGTADRWPDYEAGVTLYDWGNTVFGSGAGSVSEIVTYVAMAGSNLSGTITVLPNLFGVNFYTTSDGYAYNNEMSIVPSTAYKSLVDDQRYYYSVDDRYGNPVAYSTNIGDMRYYAACMNDHRRSMTDTTFYTVDKFAYANVPIYRTAGIYLKLAEAINRMGYPNVAFAILKDGINSNLESDTLYMNKWGAKDFLKSGVAPFLGNAENINIFNGVSSGNSSNVTSEGNQGIHSRGSGYTQGMNSLYQFSTEVQKKWNDLGVTVGTTEADTLKASIDAVEDLICDEMALELAFEGSRFSDLCRIARHKNADNPWYANYGSQWLANKLAFKKLSVDLTDPNNWYMPFR